MKIKEATECYHEVKYWEYRTTREAADGTQTEWYYCPECLAMLTHINYNMRKK